MLRLRLPARSQGQHRPQPLSERPRKWLEPTSCVFYLCVAWGRRRSEGAGLPVRVTELPVEPEDLLSQGSQRFPSVAAGGEIWGGPGLCRVSGSRPLFGAMVSSSVRAGVTTLGMKGLGRHCCGRCRSSALGQTGTSSQAGRFTCFPGRLSP